MGTSYRGKEKIQPKRDASTAVDIRSTAIQSKANLAISTCHNESASYFVSKRGFGDLAVGGITRSLIADAVDGNAVTYGLYSERYGRE
jgi:hypothetical protein